MTDVEMMQEARELVTVSALPRLSGLFALLGQSEAASACVSLQYQLLPIVLPRRSKSRRKK